MQWVLGESWLMYGVKLEGDYQGMTLGDAMWKNVCKGSAMQSVARRPGAERLGDKYLPSPEEEMKGPDSGQWPF